MFKHLIEFLMQDKFYTIIGRVNLVKDDSGWCYLACKICPKGVVSNERGSLVP